MDSLHVESIQIFFKCYDLKSVEYNLVKRGNQWGPRLMAQNFLNFINIFGKFGKIVCRGITGPIKRTNVLQFCCIF